MQNHTNMGFPAPTKSPSPSGAEAGKGETEKEPKNVVFYIVQQFNEQWIAGNWYDISPFEIHEDGEIDPESLVGVKITKVKVHEHGNERYIVFYGTKE